MINLFIKSNLKNILNLVLILTLFFWASVSSVKLLKASTKVLVIKVHKNGTEVLNEDVVDKRSRQDLINLTNKFILTYYSYNQTSFDEQKRSALELFSEDLFAVELKKAINEKVEISKRNFSQEAIIKKIDILAGNTIEIDLQKTVFEKAQNYSVSSTLILNLNPIERFIENPYGYEITNIIEKKRY